MDLLIASTAYFDAQYTLPLGYTSLPAMEPIFMIWPDSLLTIQLETTLVTYNKPFTFVSIMVSQSSKLPFCMGSRPWLRPALFTNTFTFFHLAGSPSRLSVTCALSRTSNDDTATSTSYLS